MIDHQSLSAPKQTPLDADAVRQTSGRGKTTDPDVFTDEEIAVEETIYDTADSLPFSSKPIPAGSFHRDSVLDDRAAAESDLASDVSISKDDYDAVLQSLLCAEHWIDAQLESLSTSGTNQNTNNDGFRTVDSAAFYDSATLQEQIAKNNKDTNKIDTESVGTNQTTLESKVAGITASAEKEKDRAVDLGRPDKVMSDISAADEVIFGEVAPHVVVPNVDVARNETVSNFSVPNADGTHDEVTYAAASDAATSGMSSETVKAVHTDTLHSGASDKIVLNQDVLDEDEKEITGSDADAAKAVLADPIISDITSAADVSDATADADASNVAEEILSGSGTTRTDESGQAVPTAQTSDGFSQNESTSEQASTLQQRQAGMSNNNVPSHDFAARYSESVPGQVSSSSAFSKTEQTKRPSSSSEMQDQTESVGSSAVSDNARGKFDTAEFSAATVSHADADLVVNTDLHFDTAEKIESNQPDMTDMHINSRNDRGTDPGAEVGTDKRSGVAKQTQDNRKKAIGTRTSDTRTYAQNDTERNAKPDEKVEVLTRKAMRGDTVAFRVWRNGTRTTLVQGTLFDDAGVSTNKKQQKSKHRVLAKNQRINKWFASRTAHVLAVSFSAVLVLAAIFFGTFGLLLRGPSPALRNETVRVLREHTISAWVPSLFLSDTELQRILLAQAGEQS